MTTATKNAPASAQQIYEADCIVAQLCEIDPGVSEEEVEFIGMLSERDPFTVTEQEYSKLVGIATERMY